MKLLMQQQSSAMYTRLRADRFLRRAACAVCTRVCYYVCTVAWAVIPVFFLLQVTTACRLSEVVVSPNGKLDFI
jgi:hypothetical protein